MKRGLRLIWFLAFLSVVSAIARADTTTTGGDRVIDNPASGGRINFRLNDGTQKFHGVRADPNVGSAILQINSSPLSNTSPRMYFSRNETLDAVIATNSSASSPIAGSATGDLAIYVNGGSRSINFSTDAGASKVMSISSAGAVSVGVSSQSEPMQVFRDTNAGTANIVSFDVGNSGVGQGEVRLQYQNAAASGSPYAALAFQPRNNANTTNINPGNIIISKDAGADTGKIDITANRVLLNGFQVASAAVAIGGDCTSSPCAVTANNGGMVDTVTRSGTGAYTVNFVSSYWASPGPTCTVSATAGGQKYCGANISGLSTTTLGVNCIDSSANAAADARFAVVCHGLR